jgi:hypothetical protein
VINARSLVAAVGTLISILLYTVTRSNSYGFDPQAFPTTGTALADSSSYGSFATASRPAEVSYEGLNKEAGHVYYTIKINTSRRVDRVELSVRYLDDAGRLVFDAPYVWQNISNSKPRPIEAGKTYEVEDYLYPGAAGAEVRLVRLVFADQRTWQPGD